MLKNEEAYYKQYKPKSKLIEVYTVSVSSTIHARLDAACDEYRGRGTPLFMSLEGLCLTRNPSPHSIESTRPALSAYWLINASQKANREVPIRPICDSEPTTGEGDGRGMR